MTKRWLSEEQLSQLPPRMTVRAIGGAPVKQKPSARRATTAVATISPSKAPAATPKERIQALGRLPAGTMNKTEAAYEQHLAQRKWSGEVVWYKFEGIKLRLANKTFYTVDFFVMLATGELEAHEVKGFWEEDARVKIKVAADQYPLFRFIAVKKSKKTDALPWTFEEF